MADRPDQADERAAAAGAPDPGAADAGAPRSDAPATEGAELAAARPLDTHDTSAESDDAGDDAPGRLDEEGDGRGPTRPDAESFTDSDRETLQAAIGAFGSAPPEARPFDFPDFAKAKDANVDPERVTMLNDVNLRVRLQLGQTRMYLEDVLKLGEGSVVELDKLAGDPVDVLVNDRLIARGEVLVLNDVFCVRICEVLSNDPHRITV